MSTFSKVIVRCEVDVDEIVKPFLTIKGGTPRIWQGVGVEFQLLLKRDGAILDVSNIAYLSLTVLAKARTGAPYMTATVAGGNLDNTVVAATWNDGSKQHAAVPFTGEETNLTGSESGTEYFLILHGYTTDAPTDPDNFGWSKLMVHSDGVPTDAGPVQAGNSVPVGATYDGSGHYALTVLADTYYRWTAGANDTSVTNGTEPVLVTGTNFVTQSTSVTLNGTAGAAVTATIRKSPTLPADDIRALIQDLIGDVVGVLHGKQELEPGDETLVVDLSGHALAATPARIMPFIIKPAAGDNLSCALVDGTATASAFTVHLSAPVAQSGFYLGYILIR